MPSIDPTDAPTPARKDRALKIYVASSWRNTYQPEVVRVLREDGHEVYDFKDEDGFSWREVDPSWEDWPKDIPKYLNGLQHPAAERGFNRDMTALKNADICVYVMPCGVSASLECGYAIGAGKPTVVYVPGVREPDLMVKMADVVTDDLDAVRQFVSVRADAAASRAPSDLTRYYADTLYEEVATQLGTYNQTSLRGKVYLAADVDAALAAGARAVHSDTTSDYDKMKAEHPLELAEAELAVSKDEHHHEHLAFVAVMNALDVHMPPEGKSLLRELRSIAETVGYPWTSGLVGGQSAACAVPETQEADETLWQVVYAAAADGGSILHDDTVSAITNAVLKLRPKPTPAVPVQDAPRWREQVQLEIAAQEGYAGSDAPNGWPELTPSHHRHTAAVLKNIVSLMDLHSSVPVQDAPPKAWVMIGPAEQQGQGSMWACTKCGAAIQRHQYPEPEAECEFCEPPQAVQDALTTPLRTEIVALLLERVLESADPIIVTGFGGLRISVNRVDICEQIAALRRKAGEDK